MATTTCQVFWWDRLLRHSRSDRCGSVGWNPTSSSEVGGGSPVFDYSHTANVSDSSHRGQVSPADASPVADIIQTRNCADLARVAGFLLPLADDHASWSRITSDSLHVELALIKPPKRYIVSNFNAPSREPSRLRMNCLINRPRLEA